MTDAFAPRPSQPTAAPLFAGAALLAEGCGRRSPSDKGRFYAMARGSATECAAIVDLLGARGLIDRELRSGARALLVRIVQMLSQLAARMAVLCKGGVGERFES